MFIIAGKYSQMWHMDNAWEKLISLNEAKKGMDKIYPRKVINIYMLYISFSACSYC